MMYSGYVKRAAVMLFVAMPLTAVAVGLAELLDPVSRAEGAASVLGGALGMVYVWGALSGLAVSLLHTAAWRAIHLRPPVSIAAAFILAIVGGALTPTLFTGLMHGPTILWAGFAGVVYGILERRLPEPAPSVSEVGAS